MSDIVEYLADDQLKIGAVAATDKKRMTLSDERGRTTKLAPDKVLFRHRGDLPAVLAQIEQLQAEVDVPFLWEAVADDAGASEAPALAELFFDAADALHSSAIFRALSGERLHFRRRGKTFEPRSADEIEQLRQQREAEACVAAEVKHLRDALSRPATIDDELADRLVAIIRGKADKALSEVLALQPFTDRGREEPVRAFSLLLDSGRVPLTTDIEVVAAGLRHEHSAAAREQASATLLERPAETQLLRAAFTIDDPDTREVDDALTVSTDGDLLRVDVDIADVARFVARDDALDREAQRRASTVYLPTGIYYMMPEEISAERASLHAEKERPALRTSVWIDASGEVTRFELARAWLVVERRLDYETADALLSGGAPDDEVAEALRHLRDLGIKLRQRRAEAGALFVTRREWKLRVSEDGQQITIKQLQADSPSRQLVAELMILANRLAAEHATKNDIPLIYRVQPAPTDPLPTLDPDDPALFLRLRGLIAPAKLSLHPAPHWGLGVGGYCQVTSPLRRYSDLVLQRQVAAGIDGDPPPYRAEDLLTVLANVEGVDQEMKRLEAAVSQRWALEYVARSERRNLPAMIVAETQTGYRAQLTSCGATGLLQGKKSLELGQIVDVDVVEIRPRRGALKMRLSQ